MSRPRKFLLFDIDQTLLHTDGAGLRALSRAFREVFELPGDGDLPLDLAGATDHGLFEDFLAQRGEAEPPGLRSHFFSIYTDHLRIELEGGPKKEGRVLPGVESLLDLLRERNEHLLGLLTGNTRCGAEIKMTSYGLAGHFEFDIGAYGDDHPDRNRLGPVALERAAGRGHTFEPTRVVIIGDTPRDIHCARHLGAAAVAVATGGFSAAELALHEPDLLLTSLEEPTSLLELLDA